MYNIRSRVTGSLAQPTMNANVKGLVLPGSRILLWKRSLRGFYRMRYLPGYHTMHTLSRQHSQSTQIYQDCLPYVLCFFSSSSRHLNAAPPSVQLPATCCGSVCCLTVRLTLCHCQTGAVALHTRRSCIASVQFTMWLFVAKVW